MGVHDDHRRRVYERFLREGLAGFEEHNAMEFLLFLARPRGDTNPLAHALIDRFGSLSAVLDAPIEELERVPGVGHSSAVVLKFIPQMCAYYLENKTSHKVPLTSVEEASAFFMPKFFARTQEAFYMAAVDDRRVLLRAGGLLFHQPGEVFAMTTVGEVPPETLRIDFYCTGAAMDRFRGAMLHTEPAEQHDLNWLANAANELFDAAPVPGGRPVLKEELPFGAMQQFIIHLENLLILLARRCRRTKRPVARVRRERRQNALVEDARAYFAENLAHELKIDDICTALGCTRPQLQQAFRARLHRTAMEEFSAMRIEYAAQLLARGASPGEVAAQMGYCSGAYFSQKFRAATGHTPSAYRRIQQGLPARRQNRQQKGKSESKTPIAETPQKE